MGGFSVFGGIAKGNNNIKTNYETYARHNAPTRHTPSAFDNARAKTNSDDEIKRAREALIEQIEDACNFSMRTTTLDADQVLAALTIVKGVIRGNGN